MVVARESEYPGSPLTATAQFGGGSPGGKVPFTIRLGHLAGRSALHILQLASVKSSGFGHPSLDKGSASEQGLQLTAVSADRRLARQNAAQCTNGRNDGPRCSILRWWPMAAKGRF